VLGLCSVLNILTFISTFSSFLDEKTFKKLNLPIYMLVMAMTHDRQKSADIVGRHYRLTKIGRVSLKNRPTFLGRFLSADKNYRRTCLKTRRFVGGDPVV